MLGRAGSIDMRSHVRAGLKRSTESVVGSGPPRTGRIMNRFVYSLLIGLLLPFAVLRLGVRSLKEKAYRQHMLERFGVLGLKTANTDIWVHAVSAGESIAIGPLVERLLDAGFSITLTTTTPAGRSQLTRDFSGRALIYYAPFDTSGAIKRFLTGVRPRMALLVETEIWPNWLAVMSRQNMFVALVNGRLSLKSSRGYQKLQPLIGQSLAHIHWIAVQSEAHRTRFIDLGASSDQVSVTGSIKSDQSLPSDFAIVTKAMQADLKDQRILLAASTHPGEEAMMLRAFERLRKRHEALRLVLVPRHVPRADEICRLARDFGFTAECRSQVPMASTADVLVVDQMGQLLYWYGISEVAFVGGSLVDHGGHNFLEAALAECAIVTGDSLFNFESQADEFEQAGAIRVVHSDLELVEALDQMLSDESLRVESVARALQTLELTRGALDDVFDTLSGKL